MEEFFESHSKTLENKLKCKIQLLILDFNDAKTSYNNLKYTKYYDSYFMSTKNKKISYFIFNDIFISYKDTKNEILYNLFKIYENNFSYAYNLPKYYFSININNEITYFKFNNAEATTDGKVYILKNEDDKNLQNLISNMNPYYSEFANLCLDGNIELTSEFLNTYRIGNYVISKDILSTSIIVYLSSDGVKFIKIYDNNLDTSEDSVKKDILNNSTFENISLAKEKSQPQYAKYIIECSLGKCKNKNYFSEDVRTYSYNKLRSAEPIDAMKKIIDGVDNIMVQNKDYKYKNLLIDTYEKLRDDTIRTKYMCIKNEFNDYETDNDVKESNIFNDCYVDLKFDCFDLPSSKLLLIQNMVMTRAMTKKLNMEVVDIKEKKENKSDEKEKIIEQKKEEYVLKMYDEIEKLKQNFENLYIEYSGILGEYALPKEQFMK